MTAKDYHFPQFSELGLEIRQHILSFVATGPMEEMVVVGVQQQHPQPPPHGGYVPGTLTSIIPHINRECRQHAELNYFWEPAMKRQLLHPHHGSLWAEGLQRLLPLQEFMEYEQQKQASQRQEQQENDEDDDEEKEEQTSEQQPSSSQTLSPCGEREFQLLKTVRAHLPDLSYKQLTQKILSQHIHFDAPMFVMPCHLRIGQRYGLHLFEPRYRIMMHDLMQGTADPQASSQGGPIRPTILEDNGGMVTPPLLIHANLGSRLAAGENACLVQVVQCQTYEQGEADVQLLPVAWVRLDRIWVRPNAGHLFYARATRLPSNGAKDEFYSTMQRQPIW